MRADQEMARLVRSKMKYAAHSRMREQMWTVIRATLRDLPQGMTPAAHGMFLQGETRRSRTVQVAAAAAVLLLGILLLTRHPTDPDQNQSMPPAPPTITQENPNPPARLDVRLQAERETAGQMFARHDLAGLVQLLTTGQDATKVQVAEYLAQIGDDSVLSALQVYAARWQGPAQDNPFLKAIAVIRARRTILPPATAAPAREPNNPPAPPAAIPQPPSDPQNARTGVAGVVMDKLAQKPIPGATVRCRLDDPATATRTDAAGRFVLTGLQPSDTCFIYILAQGYASERIAPRVVQDQITHDLFIELDRGSRVEGTVTDSNGKPIAEATVQIYSFTNLPVVTGADGRFEIDGINPLTYGPTLHVTHPDYPAVSVSFTPGAIGETAHKDVVLRPGVDIFGQVTDPNGKPLGGVLVGNTSSPRMTNCIKARTDEAGEYRLPNVPVGQHVLWASAGRYAIHVELTRLYPATTEKRIDIRLQPPVPLHGKVIDDANEPVPGVSVRVQEYNGTWDLATEGYATDANGLFVIPNAPAQGTLMLELSASGMAGEQPELEMGQPEYVLKVHRVGRIYGQVVDDKTGQPVPEFVVKLTRSEPRGRATSYSATWEQEGYSFQSPQGLFDTETESLPVGGNFKVTVVATGFDPLTVDPTPVQPITDDPNRMVFRLKALTMLAGVVIDAQGHPVKDAVVALFTRTERFDPLRWRKCITAADGVFVIPGPGNEEEFIYITAPGFDPQHVRRSELDTRGGRPVRIALSAARIFGRVVDEQGRPRTNAVIHMTTNRDLDEVPSIPTFTREVPVDANGQYELSDLPSGHFWLNARFRSGYGWGPDWALKRISLQTGQCVQINFGDETGFVLAGVVRRGPTPVKPATIEVCMPQGDSKSIDVNDAGAFRLPGIAAGQVHIKVRVHETDDQWSTWTRLRAERSVQIQGDTQVDIDLNDSTAGQSPKEPPSSN